MKLDEHTKDWLLILGFFLFAVAIIFTGWALR